MPLLRRTFLTASAAGAVALSTSGQAAVGPTLAAAPPSRPLRILVLGGTRYLGPAFVRAALARGHDLTLFNRGKTQTWLFPGVERRVGDRFPERGEGLKALETGEWDVTVDLCGQYPRVVEASTRLLADRTRRYILVSSISVYADLKQIGLDETARHRPLNKPFEELPELYENDWGTYGGRKSVNEGIVTAAFGDRAAILRPCSICGGDNNDGSGAYWPARLHGGGKVLAPGNGSDPTQLIDVADAADFLVLAAERSLSGAYNLLGPKERLTLREYLDTAARVVGSKAQIVWKGDFPAQMRGLPMAPPYGLVPGFSTMSNAKAVAAGLKFRPLEETLRSNWIDHRARRGDRHDFAAGGIGLSAADEARLGGWA